MGKLIGFFIVLAIACKFSNKRVDNMRVKKWWGEDKDGK